MKEHVIPPEELHLSHEGIANLSDAQFKTLVIKMLTEMVEYGHKIREEVCILLNFALVKSLPT